AMKGNLFVARLEALGNFLLQGLRLERREFDHAEVLVGQDLVQRPQQIGAVDQTARGAVEVARPGIGHVKDQRTRIGGETHGGWWVKESDPDGASQDR